MKDVIKDRIEKIEQGIVPEGYKETKVGIIPKDWEVEKLSDINKINSGLTPLRSNSQYFGGNIHWVKTADLNNSYIIDTEENVTELALKETSLKYVKKNSVLIAMYGGFNQIGRTGLMKIDGTTNQAISSFYVNEINYNSEYIVHWLNFYRDYWKKFASSSRKDPNITKKDVENFPIPKLEYKEQEKIADLLSTWDQAIEKIEKLIKEKEIQKKGLMQELLTGERRLPGFSGEWEFKKLGQISKSFSGGTPRTTVKEYYDSGTIPWIRSQDLNKKAIFKVNGYITEKGLRNSSAKEIKKDTLLIALYGATSGIPAISYIDATINQAVLAIEFKNQDKYFYYNYLMFNRNKIINKYTQGGQPNLSGTLIKALEVPNPSLPEQKAIADILATADQEIELLTKLLENKKHQKKGLMQLLLTGILRVEEAKP